MRLKGIYLELALCYFKIPHAFNSPNTTKLQLCAFEWFIWCELVKEVDKKIFECIMNGDGSSGNNLIGVIS